MWIFDDRVVLLATFAIGILSIFFIWRRTRSSSSVAPYYCPNPNCVRCRRYKQVNENARRRIPWLDENVKRVVDAVQMGPKVMRNESLHSSAEAPIDGQYPTVLLIRGLTAKPTVTNLHESYLVLPKNGKEMLNEYLKSVTTSNDCKWLVNDSQGTEWRVLHLMNQGAWIAQNTAACPAIMNFLHTLQPNLMNDCLFGNIFLSALEPGTFIEPHCGPANVRHRLHLPLQIPNHAAGQQPTLTVLKEIVTWNQDSYFVFDDSLRHSVSYPSPTADAASPRVVLIADVWHVELTQPERQAITQLYPRVSAK